MTIDERVRKLERHNRALRYGLAALIALLVCMAPANPAQDHLLLESPNGQYKILLKATDTCAGIWVSGDPSGSMAVMINQEKNRSVLGVYGPKLDGKGWKMMDAAMTAHKDGGYIMLANPDQTDPKFITGK